MPNSAQDVWSGLKSADAATNYISVLQTQLQKEQAHSHTHLISVLMSRKRAIIQWANTSTELSL